jgi:hypothetical protein
MKNNYPNNIRVLSIAPSTNGFGFALMKDAEILADWGTQWVEPGNKNDQTLMKVGKLITRLRPETIVLPDALEKDSRRGERIRKLVRQLTAFAKQHGLKVELITQEQLRQVFFGGKRGSKYARAEILAARFPEELQDLLPRERQPWMSEDHKMDMFDAVALAIAVHKIISY